MPRKNGLDVAKHAAIDRVGDDDILPCAYWRKIKAVEEVPNVAVEVEVRTRVHGVSCRLTSHNK